MTIYSVPQTITGTIIKRKLGKGSQKDKMVNAVLTEDGLDIVIRHNNGTAFQDVLFDSLEGKKVKITGTMQSFVLIVTDVVEMATGMVKEKNSEDLTAGGTVVIMQDSIAEGIKN